jgi:(1->4)-alpha-D-glucan 1-alpha-D-glucosylmutase
MIRPERFRAKRIPTATYRLQFRGRLDFEAAGALAPYLAQLGVSHVYASPVFAAVPNSTHGYDVVDFSRFETDLGGRPGFEDMQARFADHGLGLILDFVPNHMGADPHNPWWRDVLEWGEASPHGGHFDIDWSANKLIIPALGQSYASALADGALGLYFDERDGGLSMTYGPLILPLTPPSYATLLGYIEGDEFAELARRFAVSTPDLSPGLKTELAEIVEHAGRRVALQTVLDDVVADRDVLHQVHEAQAWRLTHWRAARERLTYRRFFEIADLVGIRVEQPAVFEDVHRLLIELVRGGRVDGIRLDHIDGLADPKGYLDQLQAALADDEGTDAEATNPVYTVVEKIVAPHEDIPDDWLMQGTTGYEFARALTELAVDPAGERELTEAYHAFVGDPVSYAGLIQDAKHRIIAYNLAGELELLKGMAHSVAERNIETRDLGPDSLRRAIIEFAKALPVYRTYVSLAGASDDDRERVARAIEIARQSREVEDEAAFDFLERMMVLDFESPEDQTAALEFTMRLQQTTGPVMAKALEDTIFYRYNRLIALNEVGGEPDRFGGGAAAFHDEMIYRQTSQPLGLSTTSTHDTKRGEDARARIATISEAPGVWSAAVARWHSSNERFCRHLGEHFAPDRATEWMFYQSLLGVWPNLANGERPAPGDLLGLCDRMIAFMLKAVREAKAYTTWTAQNQPYEDGIEAFVSGVLDPTQSQAFLDDFAETARRFQIAGALTSLSHTAIKMTAPGIPDIYQGSEAGEFSLVDPDNRRPVDWEMLHALASNAARMPNAGAAARAAITDWIGGGAKMHVVLSGLRLRAARPQLFTDGAYLPVATAGEHADKVVAFARQAGDDTIMTIAPRLAFGLLDRADGPHVPAACWGDTRIVLPEGIASRDRVNLLDGQSIRSQDDLLLSNLLANFPVSIVACP